MDEPIKKLMLPYLQERGFQPADDDLLNKEGHSYTLSEAIGKGYYWYYEREGMFALAVMDLCLNEDTLIEYDEREQPDFISISYYHTVSAEQLTPYKRLNANCVSSHVSDQGIYRARYHKNVPIRSMELMLVPAYFRDYLSQKYPDRVPDIKASFSRINDIADFPALILLMRQIQAFQGTGVAAHLFYESKVAEIVSLILEKAATTHEPSYSCSRKLSDKDVQNLDTVRSYLSDHFAFQLHAEALAKMSCMSESKLRSCFKSLYGCTITEFVQNKRMAQAEYMLLHTDLQINQIASAVGYHHSGRFASLFQKSTGLLPEEYRKLLK